MSKLLTLRDRLVRQPRLLQLLLDATFLIIAVATFGQVWDPDGMFHVMWVILAIEAFLFGLRATAVRIAIASVLLLTYFNLGTFAAPGSPRMAALELVEWPLMVVIAVIVAVMADRVATTGRRYAELYRRASDRLLTAQEDERKRLGRDLHDGVGQTLTAVVLTLDAAETLLWAEDRAPSAMARSAIQRAQELAAVALDETRDVSYQLRPDRFVETGLVAAAHRLAASAGAPVTVTGDPALAVPGLLAPEDETHVYRIIQEAVSNAVRHARARHVTIAFTTDGAVLSVAIVDDGIGFEAKTSEERGLGVAGMRERARILRGRLEITSRRREGATVLLTVPLPRRDAPPLPSATVPVIEVGGS